MRDPVSTRTVKDANDAGVNRNTQKQRRMLRPELSRRETGLDDDGDSERLVECWVRDPRVDRPVAEPRETSAEEGSSKKRIRKMPAGQQKVTRRR
jgi:hypothetical protein